MWLILIKLAWKNIFRNKRRTIIASTAIGIGLAALIFVDGLWVGMERNLVQTATDSFLGDGQIHQQGFRDTRAVEMTVNELNEVVAALSENGLVEHFTPRVFALGMITAPANVSAVSMVGVQPETERFLSQIDDTIVQGTYFESDNERAIVVGTKLAENLEVELGARVVVTVTQAGGGDLSQEMFRISGIYRFADEAMNATMAFVQLNKAQQMLAIGSDVHEIAIKFTDTAYGRDKALPFWKEFSQNGNEAVSWTEILPQLEAVFEMSKFSKFVMGIVLFGVVVFGIINTLFMSLYERMFEFGVLRAVGTRPFGMARLILFEAGALAILSIGLGIVLGFGVTFLFTKVGIDYTDFEMMGVTMQELIYPVMQVKPFILNSVWVFVFTIITGLYPARYAAKMSPATAMRRSF